MTRSETIGEIFCATLILIFAMGWIDTLWILGVENSKQYTWWALIQYFGN